MAVILFGDGGMFFFRILPSGLSRALRQVVIASPGLMCFLAVAATYGEEPAPEKQALSSVAKLSPVTDQQPSDDLTTAAKLIEDVYGGERPPESVRMLTAILRGNPLSSRTGWFGPRETRYTWEWLARHCGVDPATGAIPRASFRGPDATFARLDRNQDGAITPDDFDWSDTNSYVQTSRMAARLFAQLNTQASDGLTKDELIQFFDKAARGDDQLSIDDFRDAVARGTASTQATGMPSTEILLRGFFAGDLGSMNEGPRIDDGAPDFTLKTVDGKRTVQLSHLLQAKPVVLAFGSFT